MQAGFRACYNRALATDPTLGGRVQLSIRIGAEGQVESVTATALHLPANVIGCVKARARASRFSPPEGGVAVVRVPVSFVLSLSQAPLSEVNLPALRDGSPPPTWSVPILLHARGLFVGSGDRALPVDWGSRTSRFESVSRLKGTSLVRDQRAVALYVDAAEKADVLGELLDAFGALGVQAFHIASSRIDARGQPLGVMLSGRRAAEVVGLNLVVSARGARLVHLGRTMNETCSVDERAPPVPLGADLMLFSHCAVTLLPSLHGEAQHGVSIEPNTMGVQVDPTLDLQTLVSVLEPFQSPSEARDARFVLVRPGD